MRLQRIHDLTFYLRINYFENQEQLWSFVCRAYIHDFAQKGEPEYI